MLGTRAEDEDEPLPWLHRHWLRRRHDERCRGSPPGRPATVELLLLISCSKHLRCRESLLRTARECHRQRHLTPRRRPERHARLRSRLEDRLPDRLPVGVEEDHPRSREARADAAVGSVPDDDPIDGLVGAKIDLPPRIGLRRGVGDGVGDEEAPFGDAVNGPACQGVERCRRLRRRLATGDVFATAEGLHLGQRKNLLVTGELDAHKPPPRRRRRIDRLEPRADPGEDEIAGMPRRPSRQ